MSKLKATWTIELNTECPFCGEYVDLCDADDFWSGRLFKVGENGTENTRDVEAECPRCHRTLVVDFEY